MDPSQIADVLQSRALYPIIATLLTVALQIGKTSPLTKTLYAKVPVGWRWLTPVLVGAAAGFVHGFQQHLSVVGSLVEALFGVFGVGATAMGINAGLKESPLPWGGGAGGAPLPTKSPSA